MLDTVDDIANIKDVLKENDGKFVYKITPVKYKGILKESRNGNTISIKSQSRLNRREVFEKTQKYFSKKYNVIIESIDVEASADLEPGFLKALHKIVNITFPTFNVYQRKIEDAEDMNDIEVKSLIDVLLSEDISEMLGSSESLSTRIQNKIKSLEEKDGKVYRIYKDGIALDTFFKNVCKEESVGKDAVKGSTNETLKLDAKNLKNCDVKLILNTKDYCLAFVSSK